MGRGGGRGAGSSMGGTGGERGRGTGGKGGGEERRKKRRAFEDGVAALVLLDGHGRGGRGPAALRGLAGGGGGFLRGGRGRLVRRARGGGGSGGRGPVAGALRGRGRRGRLVLRDPELLQGDASAVGLARDLIGDLVGVGERGAAQPLAVRTTARQRKRKGRQTQRRGGGVEAPGRRACILATNVCTSSRFRSCRCVTWEPARGVCQRRFPCPTLGARTRGAFLARSARPTTASRGIAAPVAGRAGQAATASHPELHKLLGVVGIHQELLACVRFGTPDLRLARREREARSPSRCAAAPELL